MKQNITLSLEQDLLRQVRAIATRKSTSVSRMLGDELRCLVDNTREYERSRRQALAMLEAGFNLGGRPAGREELHER